MNSHRNAMNYNEALGFIHSLDKFGSRPGLDRVQKLFDRVPEVLDQEFIHIAGTNGKGSVSAMLSSVLCQAGCKVGLFISPYIIEFRERIQINGEMISEDELAAAVSYFEPILRKLNDEGVIITEFEFLTVLAFWIYKQNRCDIVVCEVGMGGLLDSTNLIRRPLCSVITRIALDHTEILGATLSEIAVQKCGIIKRGSAVAVSAQSDDAMRVIRDTAAAMNDPLYFGDNITLHDVDPSINGTSFVYKGAKMRLNLIGAHQQENLRCALAAIEALREIHGMDITDEHIREGLAAVSHPARFERLNDEPLVILDGAHNPNGLAAFAQAVRDFAPHDERTLIIGMLADKDSTGLEALKGLFTRIIVTDIDNPRALKAEELAHRLSGICVDVTVVSDPTEAYKSALSFGNDIYICGSLYLASQIRPYIIGK